MFTYIVEFKGGTYVSQVKALNINDSIEKWAAIIPHLDIKDLDIKAQAQLQTEIFDQEPVPLSDVKNVWCLFFSLKAGRMLINIVRTSE